MFPTAWCGPATKAAASSECGGSQIWGISLYKSFRFTERFSLQMRGESFNTFNHPNPSGFASLLNTSSLFGGIGSFREARVVQLAAKLYF